MMTTATVSYHPFKEKQQYIHQLLETIKIKTYTFYLGSQHLTVILINL